MTLPNDYARCLGHGEDEHGHQKRMDCEHCLRRTAHRPDPCWFMAPSDEFPCPMRIAANGVNNE